MTPMAETNPATLPTKLRYLSAFMVTGGGVNGWRQVRVKIGLRVGWRRATGCPCKRPFKASMDEVCTSGSLIYQNSNRFD
jgi:hypothetical protein